MGASAKGIVVLSDKREIEVDVSTMTLKEWRNIWSPSTSDEESDKVVARLANMKSKDLESMLRDDYRRIISKIFELSNRPLDDPNSPSASI